LKPDDVFRIGSVSKQFAAAGLLKLVEAGKVSLDDPLSKYIPDYPNGEHITVQELLNHTSGVKSYTSIASFIEGPVEKDVTTTQLIAKFKDEKADFAPGEGWAYDNSGYVLVGAVIEAASGKPWHEYLRTSLFEPLGLTHTFYGASPDAAAKQVPGYSMDNGKFVAPKKISMTIPHAAGALLSNVDDLMKWNRALHEGRVLKNASYTQMITPVGKAVDRGYGFGIEQSSVRGQNTLSHSGGIFGFASMLDYAQGPDISVVVLQNTDNNGDHDEPEIIARKLLAATLGDAYPVPVAIPVDAATLKLLEGVYPIDKNAARVLRVVDGVLTAQRTGGQRSKLIPIGKDNFLYDDGLNRFTVERDAAGAVTGMRFFREGEGPGIVVARSTTTLPADHQEVPLKQAEVDRLLGNYASGGMNFKVFLEANRLMAQMAGQPALEIFAESPSVFFLTAVDATLEFGAGKELAPTVTLHQGSNTLEFKRVP
jgi:CubicO group peptidase (beta-lactamase class C family)